ncbi:MAG: glycosyltransferase [Clostridiales bacterium]|nr:glycosyltransferase [Clostridiales bacterium]
MSVNNYDIVIPVFRPKREDLNSLLKKLFSQSIPPKKVVLINTISEDTDLSYIRDDRVEIVNINKKDFDHGGTRRLGESLCREEYVIFMTQDAVPNNEKTAEELLKPFSDPEVGVSYARQLPKKDCTPSEVITRGFNYPPGDKKKTLKDVSELGIKAYFCSDVCAAYRRSTYEKLGGFDHPLLFNEDMLMAYKMLHAGFAVYYASKAEVIHSHNYTCAQQFHRNFDLGSSQADHPEVFESVSSESEGMKLVKTTLRHLIKIGKPYLIPAFCINCAARYAGFFLGKRYRRLPGKFVLWATSDSSFWINMRGY